MADKFLTPPLDLEVEMRRKSFIKDLRDGAKPETDFACGIEYELLAYDRLSLRRLAPPSIENILRKASESEADLMFEDKGIIGARLPDGYITIEPGGQIEFSGAPPHWSLAKIANSVESFLQRLREIATSENVLLLSTGFDPLRALHEQQWFPKKRYQIMRPFLKSRGARAEDMMTRTCAVQTSIDFSSEPDLIEKMNLATRAAPFITAMFANSPFENCELSGYKSTRAAVWLATDGARTSGAPSVFSSDGFSIKSFVDDALNVSPIFQNQENYFLLDGWHKHLSTLFYDVRLRNYLEMRMADCNAPQMNLAFVALWKGLCYDAFARREALQKVVPHLSRDEHLALQANVAREGLNAKFQTASSQTSDVLSVAKDLVRLASEGLARIAFAELGFLDSLRERVIEDELCPADILIKSWQGSWHKNADKLIAYLRV